MTTNFLNFNVVEIGLFVLGLAYIWSLYKQGGIRASGEVIATYKEQVAQLREELRVEKEGRAEDRHNLNNRITSTQLELATMKGALEEKDKKIAEYKEIFQGKDPEQEQYMKDMRAFTKDLAEYMAHSTKTLGEISIFMKNINQKST